MSSEDNPFGPMTIIYLILCLASCIHVFLDSKRDRHIGHPWMHAIMCAILWPLPYILWLLWWPGKLRQVIFGSDSDRVKRRLEEERIKTSEPTVHKVDDEM